MCLKKGILIKPDNNKYISRRLQTMSKTNNSCRQNIQVYSMQSNFITLKKLIFSLIYRYISTCYFKPRTVPAWYTECILIHIGSTKRIYDEKIWFKVGTCSKVVFKYVNHFN